MVAGRAVYATRPFVGSFFKLMGPYFYTPTDGRQVGLLGDSTIRRGCFLAHGNLFLPLATHVLATTRAVSESTALGSLESYGSYEALMACNLLSFQGHGPSPCGPVRRRDHPWGGWGARARGGGAQERGGSGGNQCM